MRILLINHYAGSPSHGMEYRPYYLGREWLKMGHDVTIVAASFSHLRSATSARHGWWTSEVIDGIRYIWLSTPEYSGNGVSRAFNVFTFVLLLRLYTRRIVKSAKPDMVIASSTYPLDIFPASHIARLAGGHLVFEVHDLWPLSLIELANMSSRHPFVLLLQFAENYAYRNAYRVVSMLPHAESHMRANGLSEGKFSYVPNGIDRLDWDNQVVIPEPHRSIISALRLRGNLLIGYTGAHGLANSLTALLDAAALLRNRPVAFVLVGQGPEKPALWDRAVRMGLTNIVFLGPVPRSAIPALLAMMDVVYIGLQSQPLFRFGVSPNKLMDYMMAGKPVIHAIAAGNDLVSESGCGISIPPEDPGILAETVEKLLKTEPNDLAAMGERGREYVLANHDYKVLARRFLAAVGPDLGWRKEHYYQTRKRLVPTSELDDHRMDFRFNRAFPGVRRPHASMEGEKLL